jgi:hypothetical protein
MVSVAEVQNTPGRHVVALTLAHAPPRDVEQESIAVAELVAEPGAQRIDPALAHADRRDGVERRNFVGDPVLIGPGDVVLDADHPLRDLVVAADRAAGEAAAQIEVVRHRNADKPWADVVVVANAIPVAAAPI